MVSQGTTIPSGRAHGKRRCSRSCYNCPSCTSPLATTTINVKTEGLLKPESTTVEESYILQCHYCEWSSLEIGVQFNKPTKITEQLNKQRKSRTSGNDEKVAAPKPGLTHDDAFTNLTTFYKDQLSESGDPQSASAASPYSSPANLARIMSLYGGLSYNALKKSKEKPQPMREAMSQSEGFQSFDSKDSDVEIIQKVQLLGWDGTSTSYQCFSSPYNVEARFTGQLWPAATPLRTRRAKRCKTCRHIIARPDPKVGSMRYKIRLLAMNYIPRLSIRELNPTTPVTNSAFHLRSDPLPTETLAPNQTSQYILTIRNPIFETIKVTLATPTRTPGKIASRVTILCPTFSVGPAGDVWDEALSISSSTQANSDGGRRAAMASLTGSSESSDRQPEAGKIWEKTRNSTSVVVEITTGSLEAPPSIVPKTEQELENEVLGEDDDVLEVPVYVRTEWEAEGKVGEGLQAKKEAGATATEKVSKELGYWVVLNVGRVGG